MMGVNLVLGSDTPSREILELGLYCVLRQVTETVFVMGCFKGCRTMGTSLATVVSTIGARTSRRINGQSGS